MFDKLIASDEKGSDFKNRKRYFVVSTIFVGILFASAVVFSIYAAEINLGTNNFEISEIIAPNVTDVPEPKQRQQAPQSKNSSSELPQRQSNMLRIEENPIVPTFVSTTPNKQMSRPDGKFTIGMADKIGKYVGDAGPGSGKGCTDDCGSGSDSSDFMDNSEPTVETSKVKDLPPMIKKPQVPKGPISIGVVNGIAKSLPKPQFPQAAIVLKIADDVSVQVTIDENGNVTSAKAVKGHPVLRAVSENAAKRAKFTPTLLSNVPVKVTGVIVYKFSRN